MTATGKELGQLAWEWWGQNGVPVFPCSDTKAPLTRRGHLDASTDYDEIIEMFSRLGDKAVNIGAAMGGDTGLFAVDFDLYKSGAKEFKETLILSRQLPKTRIHKTKGGGEHWIYFTTDGASDIRNSKPHDAVDIRGTGGYIIVPPSEGYEVISDKTVVAPTALIERLTTAQNRTKTLGIDALEAEVRSGGNFHDALTMLAAKLNGAGEDVNTIQERLMSLLEASVARSPQHERHDRWRALMADKGKELSRINESAYQKFNPNKGENALRHAYRERYGTPETADTGAQETEEDDGDFPFARAFNAAEVDNLEQKPYILRPLMYESDVIVLAADPKAGKTLITMTLALHMAAGIPLLDRLIPLKADGSVGKIPVLYFALEGQGAIRRRVKAWLLMQNAEREKRGEKDLTMNDLHLYIIESHWNLADSKVRQDMVDKLVRTNALFNKNGWGDVGLVVVDTLTKAMPGKDQNSVEDTSAVFDVASMMRGAGLSSALMFIHHSRRSDGGPRGSSNILAEPDTVLTVHKDKPVFVGSREVRPFSLNVHMARTIDDDQNYRFDAVGINIGKNSQGIEEIAPVAVLMEQTSSAQTVEEYTLASAMKDSEAAFLEFMQVALTDDDLTVTGLLKKMRSAAPLMVQRHLVGITSAKRCSMRQALEIALTSDHMKRNGFMVEFEGDGQAREAVLTLVDTPEQLTG